MSFAWTETLLMRWVLYISIASKCEKKADVYQATTTINRSFSSAWGQTYHAPFSKGKCQFYPLRNVYIYVYWPWYSQAGSLGINITCANRVILFDSDWNPCHDEQGIGRVYRFGQEKNVYVYRLITYSTLEQRLMAQSVHKRGIARYRWAILDLEKKKKVD